MSTEIIIGVKNADKIAQAFHKLSDVKKLQSLRRALRRAAKPLDQAAQMNAPVGKTKVKTRQGIEHKPGNLKKSLSFKYGNSKYTPIVFYGTNKKRGVDAFYHHIVIGGSTRHEIAIPNKEGSLKLLRSGKAYYVRKVTHPGAKANDFLQKSYNQTQTIVQQNIIKELDKEIAKFKKTL